MSEWRVAKECCRRLEDQGEYTLAEVARMLGKTGAKANVTRDPMFTKMVSAGALVRVENGNDSWKTKRRSTGEVRYSFDRHRMVELVLKFWCDELKHATGKTVGVIHI